MHILCGKKYSNSILHYIKINVLNELKKGKSKPCLAIILIGNDFASDLYVRNKLMACKKVKFISCLFKISINIYESILIKIIDSINNDINIHAVLIQIPLPKKFNSSKILSHIDLNKDVDLLNPYNKYKYMSNISSYIKPCTSSAVMFLLDKFELNVKGSVSVVIGSSEIVGKPIIFELISRKSTVIVVNKYTKNFDLMIKLGDFLFVAIGKPNFIKKYHIKKGCIIIDIGINFVNNNNIVGDVDFNSVKNYVSYITPVPGGIGPLTVSKLLKNTFFLYLFNINDKMKTC